MSRRGLRVGDLGVIEGERGAKVHGHSASAFSDGADDLNRSVRSSSLDSQMQVGVLQNSEICALFLTEPETESRHSTTEEG